MLLVPRRLQAQLTTPYAGGYLEVAEDPQGWRHLAFYPSAASDEHVWLTTGEWELDGGVLAVDEELSAACVAQPIVRPRPELTKVLLHAATSSLHLPRPSATSTRPRCHPSPARTGRPLLAGSLQPRH